MRRLEVTTKIEWADLVLNPGVYGCAKVSPGCLNCYAARVAARRMGPYGEHPEITQAGNRGPTWTGEVIVDAGRFAPAFSRLPKGPHKDGSPRSVFLSSMTDIAHEAVSDAHLGALWILMAERPHLRFLVLTKRPARLQQWLARRVNREGRPVVRNIAVGVSVEDHQRMVERVPALLSTPAAMRFVSAEPLLGPLRLWPYLKTYGGDYDKAQRFRDAERYGLPAPLPREAIDWVIVGGESGPRARPMNPIWVQHLLAQLLESDSSFFFKQWGRYRPLRPWRVNDPDLPRVAPPRVALPWESQEFQGRTWAGLRNMMEVGKKAAGRTLGGRTYDERPAWLTSGPVR